MSLTGVSNNAGQGDSGLGMCANSMIIIMPSSRLTLDGLADC